MAITQWHDGIIDIEWALLVDSTVYTLLKMSCMHESCKIIQDLFQNLMTAKNHG